MNCLKSVDIERHRSVAATVLKTGLSVPGVGSQPNGSSKQNKGVADDSG
jgi:hypothetical protein